MTWRTPLMEEGSSSQTSKQKLSIWIRMAVIVLLVATAICFGLVLAAALEGPKEKIPSGKTGVDSVAFYTDIKDRCDNDFDSECQLEIVESIPIGLVFPPNSPKTRSTFEAWKELLAVSQESIDIGSFYWTLRGSDIGIDDPSQDEGVEILEELKKKGNILRVVWSTPDSVESGGDIQQLIDAGAQIRDLNMTKFLGAGVLHTKVWLVDGLHGYVGSANMDFRSLTQVKELGIVMKNCSCLVQDLAKIFEVYWLMANASEIPEKWPESLSTSWNSSRPLQTADFKVFASSAPPAFNPEGRTNDVDAIVKAIDEAEEFVYVAVMDYFPQALYRGGRNNTFWPVIDDALKRAAVDRGVDVRLMASKWNHTRTALTGYLCSLNSIGSHVSYASIETRFFQVPFTDPGQHQIPFSRVNHNKYMVTDRLAYVGTSNWSQDYFTDTCGIGLNVKQLSEGNSTKQDQLFQERLKQIFLRDWNSEYTHEVECCVT
ncbi:unnamed protein product [Cyprideis torosa]|uniref:Uncharacterized protein n=1 Tax=Cyprideis torosa TaxID=163714 RepID=A0A7R8ZNU5_9CRUS|nr:unnamed protein product [Cyprideis torosa]CAG0887143.1 unnamed protein product [Cyprideis torosa]